MGARNSKRAMRKGSSYQLPGFQEAKFDKGVYNGTHGLVDTGTWTDDICVSQLLACDVEHALQLLPVSDVGLLEDRFSGGLRTIGVAGHELLGFGAKGQVREEDVAFLVEESAREGEVDSWAVCQNCRKQLEAMEAPVQEERAT